MKKNSIRILNIFAFGILPFFVLTWMVKAAPQGQEGSIDEGGEHRDRLSYEFFEGPAYLDSGETLLMPESQNSPSDLPLYDVSMIVFESYRDKNWELYTLREQYGDGVRITYAKNSSEIQPRLNRGCTKIIFASNMRGNFDIFKINIDGSYLEQLTADLNHDVYPAWSPDGTKIAFQSYRDGQAEIYVMNADGTNQTRLTWDGDYDGEPVWSPDGTKIAFVSRRTGGYRIYAMNADGSGVVQLSSQPYSQNPTWSPDGSRIAYDADFDGDGWQDLMVMDADGTDQRRLTFSNPTTDYWARSWSPDGRYIAATNIYYMYYEGYWYWARAYVYYLNPDDGFDGREFMSSQYWDWNPDWQTFDAETPVSTVENLPLQSPYRFTVKWSSSHAGTSPLKNFDVQVRDGLNGIWTNWLTNTTQTTETFTGIGGHSYYFRVRARDTFGNLEPWPTTYDVFTQVEALAPQSQVDALSSYSKGNQVLVTWGGFDPGGSGIQSYDIQYRDALDGNWVDWRSGTINGGAVFEGLLGHTYDFRAKAIDKAGNIESWPVGNGDTSTTLYRWGIRGNLYDNFGVPISNADLQSLPAAFAVENTDVDGAYGIYGLDLTNAFTVTWAKAGYGGLPSTVFDLDADRLVTVVLPPADDLVRDGNFENGDISNGYWEASGDIFPTLVYSQPHTGHYAAMLGNQAIELAPPALVADGIEYSQIVESPDGSVIMVGKVPTYTLKLGYLWSQNPDGSWEPPAFLDVSDGIVPQIAVDNEGNLHALWVKDSGLYTNGTVYYARRNPEGSWSEPEYISTGYSIRNSFIVVDRDGIVHALWQSEGGCPILHYYSRRDSTGWSDPQSIPGEDNFCDMYFYKMILDVDGKTIHVIFSTGGYGGVFYRQLNPLLGWTSLEQISPPNTACSFQDAQIDNIGQIHVLCMAAGLNENGDIFYTRRNTDGSWSSPINISQTDTPSDKAQLVLENQTVHVFWVDWLTYDPYRIEIFQTQQNANGTWLPKNSIMTDDYFFYAMDVALDNNGLIHLAWAGVQSVQGNVTAEDIFYLHNNPDGTWSDPWLIPTPSLSYPSGLQLLAHDRVDLIWNGNEYGTPDVYHAGPFQAVEVGDSVISQAISIPITMTNPTLSFLYQLNYGLIDQLLPPGESLINSLAANTAIGMESSQSGNFEVMVSDSISTTSLLSIDQPRYDWEHTWFDLSPWVGETITLTFQTHQDIGEKPIVVFLDDVTVGSAHPDLWIDVTSKPFAALPGENITVILTYGNRGGAPAGEAQIASLLPPAYSFVSASPMPEINGNLLTWSLSDLEAGNGPLSIELTLQVTDDAVRGDQEEFEFSITTASPELEVANNAARSSTFIGTHIFLPLIFQR